jgi:hypothetical protein
MSKWLDDLHKASREVDEIHIRLILLGVSFSETGNTVMAEGLRKLAYKLKSMSRVIHTAAGEAVSEFIGATQTQSDAMISALLEVAEENTRSSSEVEL